MKPEHAHDDPPLQDLLREWKVESPLPPRFGEQVWRRIDRGRAGVPLIVNPFAALRQYFARLLVRPSFAIGYATVLLAAGCAAGLWQAHAASERANETLGNRYVQMVDPYQMPRP